MSIISPAEAQELVERIARDYGWLRRSVREQTPQDALQAIENLRRELGASARTLSTNLYRSNARFVFELIQNAEDNHYSRAKASAAEPYIKFTIRPDKIIVDSNEDGFTPEDVEAICRIGGSNKTRTDAQYYIGEKGIGFKSVFMVASKVHIQSGPFSFFFEHEPGDSGMGMITPEWEVSDEALPDPLTRMTLTLLDSLDYPDLLSQFDDLPNTLLLFLKKLGKIIIDTDGVPDEAPQVTTYSCQLDESIHRAIVLEVCEQEGEELATESLHYHITRKSLYNLPLDGKRDYNTAEVVLAFPVDDTDSTPLIYNNEVYAYLPIRDFGFPFIIQSDFVTQASREDVMENLRNKAILDGVAVAFVDAVLQFCEHPTLQYQWMDYVPEDKEISNPFWSKLLAQIKAALQKTPILRPRSKGGLKLISQLKIVAKEFKDSDGNPLVPDLANEMYLAPEYGEYLNTTKLKSLGVKAMNVYDCIERIRQDAISPNPKMKSATNDWHVRCARILLMPFEKEYLREKIPSIRNMPLIPLEYNEWTSITKGKAFFPYTDGMLIPSDLRLRLVDANAITNPTRKKLFVLLGVTDALVESVRNSILEKHKMSRERINLKSSVKHLQYLYWTHSLPPIAEKRLSLRKRTSFCVFEEKNFRVHGDVDLYFQTDEKYGIQEFLRPALEEDVEGDSLGSFINPEYLNSAPARKDHDFPSWETWLEESLGILRHPRLADPKDPTKLSKIFCYIVKKHPEKLLGTLKAHWSSYNGLINSELSGKISDVLVPSTNVGAMTLERTFLPLKDLVRHCSEFLDAVHFPFLILNDSSILEEWKFLSIFGVGMNNDLEFYMEVLRHCKASGSTLSYGLYEAIQRKYWDSTNSDADRAKVRLFVHENDLVLVPSYPGRPPTWTYPAHCVWDGPAYMITRSPLLPALSAVNNPVLTAFFRDTLKIWDASWHNLIDELVKIKKISPPDVNNIQDIYHRLQNMAPDLNPRELEDVRASFENDALIYNVLNKTWAATSSCLWSKDAQIPGKITIISQYKDLKDLFVGVLKVKIPDLGMLVEELSRAARSSPTVDDVKSLIWQINSFTPSGKALEKLVDHSIFPVRVPNGTVEAIELRDSSGNFSIIDRQPWADAFQGEVDFLHFTLEEVRKLQPFLSCLDLENRYLSFVVVEKSSFQGNIQEPSGKLTRKLRRRAHALSRCATHFNSPRALDDNQSLYQLLLYAEVFETDGITRNLEHTQNNKTVTVEVHSSKLHIEDSEVLKIYVPKDQKDQELCYLRALPTKLFNEIMMGDTSRNSTLAADSSAVAIIAALFTSSDEVIGYVLDEAGIVPVPYPDEFDGEASNLAEPGIEPTEQNGDRPEVNTADESTGPGTEGRIPTPEKCGSSTGSNLLSPTPAFSYRANYRSESPASRQPLISSFSSPPSSPPNNTLPPFSVNSSQTEYRRLLNNVIAAARSKTGGFPTRGPFNLDELLSALPVDSPEEPVSYDLPFGVRNENQLAHDMKVGAAGELYVFEILSRLEPRLPGFDRANWQSTIRRHVNVHEDYCTLDPWKGAKTADITYDDTEGEFTKILIENEYLDEAWLGAKPKYFLEVKTTTKECSTRFFVSESQYERMKQMRLTKGEVSPEVYIIFRVFNLDKEGIDMRLYVDPKGVEEGGEVVFTPESYPVLPSAN